MPYVSQSPWNAGGDIGETFSRLMLGMAQLKQQQASQGAEAARFNAQMQMQAEQQNMHNAIQQALMKQKQPGIDAQVAAHQATAGFNNARAGSTMAQQANAEDAGLAALFDSLGQSGVPVNPTTGGELPATPENVKAITAALLRQHLMQSAASSPASAATMMKPERGYTLAPGAQLVGPQGGEPLATNTNFPPSRVNGGGDDNLTQMISALRGAGDMVTSLGTDKSGMGEPPYKSNPQLGQTFTNAMQIVNALSGKVNERFGGAPVQSNKPIDSVQPNEIYNGYRFKGGDKTKKENWEKVQ